MRRQDPAGRASEEPAPPEAAGRRRTAWKPAAGRSTVTVLGHEVRLQRREEVLRRVAGGLFLVVAGTVWMPWIDIENSNRTMSGALDGHLFAPIVVDVVVAGLLLALHRAPLAAKAVTLLGACMLGALQVVVVVAALHQDYAASAASDTTLLAQWAPLPGLDLGAGCCLALLVLGLARWTPTSRTRAYREAFRGADLRLLYPGTAGDGAPDAERSGEAQDPVATILGPAPADGLPAIDDVLAAHADVIAQAGTAAAPAAPDAALPRWAVPPGPEEPSH